MKQDIYSLPEKGEKMLLRKQLVLFNDDFNTLDHVIDCLVVICDHNPLQAEQSALITHYTGSCIIKIGAYPDLTQFKKELESYELDVEII